MANTYRPKQEKFIRPQQTISATSLDKDVPRQRIQRVDDIRRDTDKVITPQVYLQDLERAFKYFLTEHLKPTVTENDTKIPVPVYYASPERWASIQRDGYLRDVKGKIYTPLIVFRTNSFSKRQDLLKDDILKGTSEYFQYIKQYSSKNRYDNYNILQNAKPVNEIYNVQVPDYVEADIQLMIWCDYREQLNEIINKLPFFSGKAFGDTYKFTIRMEEYPIEHVNVTGEDRLVRSTIPVRMTGYVVLPSTETTPIDHKKLTPSRVIMISETTSDFPKIASKIKISADSNITGSNYSKEAQTVFDLMPDPVSTTYKDAWAKFIDKQVAKPVSGGTNEWDEYDIFIFAGAETEANMLTDWKGNYDAYKLLGAEPIVNIGESFESPDGSRKLMTGFNPTIGTNKFKLNDASFFILPLTSTDTSDLRYLSGMASNVFVQRTVANRLDFALNGITVQITPYPTGWESQVLYSVKQGAINNGLEVFRNGSLVGSNTGTPSFENSEYAILHANRSGTGITGKVSFYAFGSSKINHLSMWQDMIVMLKELGIGDPGNYTP